MNALLLLGLLAVVGAAPQGPQNGPQGPQVPIPNSELFTMKKEPYLFENHNPELTDDGQRLFESDLVLTEAQQRDRKAATNLWTSKAVKYVIESTSEADRSSIESALNHWRTAVCITFTEKGTSFSGEPHLRFKKASGCWSYIGRTARNYGQHISIGSGCTGLGTVVHEIGHALGFNHEQARTDRDTYVTIMSDNIQAGKEHNFDIASTSNSFSVPYDLTSVMHYGSTYFTKNGQDTIAVNELQYSGLIGSRAGLSQRDKQLANAMYGCADSCSSPPTCYNDGYVDSSCACVCPDNTSGANCETLVSSYYGTVCGDQDITTASTITSINWPNIYPAGKACFWIITAPEGKQVKITFGTVKILYRSDGNCNWDWIKLYTDDDTVADFTKCGSELDGKTYTTTGNRLAVQMTSYAGGSYPSLQTGFTADVTFV